jgi:probable rRNA maturation factor
MLSLDLQDPYPILQKPELKKSFQKLLQVVQKEMKKYIPSPNLKVAVILIGDEEIQHLNKTYRDYDTPTDVLSFLLYDSTSPGKQTVFGELYISIPTAERQASEYGHPLQTELNTLFVHGMLHLLGFDHETPEELLEMRNFEKKILKSPGTLLTREKELNKN